MESQRNANQTKAEKLQGENNGVDSQSPMLERLDYEHCKNKMLWNDGPWKLVKQELERQLGGLKYSREWDWEDNMKLFKMDIRNKWYFRKMKSLYEPDVKHVWLPENNMHFLNHMVYRVDRDHPDNSLPSWAKIEYRLSKRQPLFSKVWIKHG